MNETHKSSMPEVTDIEVPPMLEKNIQHLRELHERGYTINNNIEKSIEFKNPYLLEKVMKVFNIDGYSSNFNKDVYGPEYYVKLANETDDKESVTDAKALPNDRKRKSGWSQER